jgi:hypothetical protein
MDKVSAVTDQDLRQFTGHRRAAPKTKLVVELVGAVFEIEKKTCSDWAKVRPARQYSRPRDSALAENGTQGD